MYAAFLMYCVVTAHSNDIMDVQFDNCERIQGKAVWETKQACVSTAYKVMHNINAPLYDVIRKNAKFPLVVGRGVKRGGCDKATSS